MSPLATVTRSARQCSFPRACLLRPAQLRRRSLFPASDSLSEIHTGPRKFEVVLDNETLYIEKDLAVALGWTPDSPIEGVPLSLHGWDPTFFTITKKGTDNEWLSRGTIESGANPNVLRILKQLK